MSDATYGYRVSWSDFNGSRTTVSASGFQSREASVASMASALADMGYKPPRWWQWWRWDEYRLSEDVLAKIAATPQGER